MTRRLLSFDPGEVTGWSAWYVFDDEPMQRFDYGVVPHGLPGLIRWWAGPGHSLVDGKHDVMVSERFELGGDVRFPNVEPLRIEGFLTYAALLNGHRMVWQKRTDKPQVPDRLLKEHGLWLTGSQVGWEDGDDVNDAQRHALIWGKFDHLPTLEGYWPE